MRRYVGMGPSAQRAGFVVCAGFDTSRGLVQWLEKESAYQRQSWPSDGVTITIRVAP